MEIHHQQCKFARLRAYGAAFHKCWIELVFENGVLTRMGAVDLGASFDNSAALGHLKFDADATRGFESAEYFQDTRRWWFNGHLLCNTTQPWSQRSMQPLLAMYGSIRLQPWVNGTVILNRRDFPWLRNDFQVPFPWRFRSGDAWVDERFFRAPMQPPLSFYGGPDWQDILVPVPEHWSVWADTEQCRAKGGLDKRKPRLVFRGTATGEHLDMRNPRVAAVCLLEQYAWADAAFSEWTRRERVEVHGTEIRVVHPSSRMGRKADALSPSQQSESQVLLYIHGHVAASRKAWQLCSGSVVLELNSDTTAPRQWFEVDPHFQAAAWDKHKASFDIQATTTHFRCNIDELVDAARWILDHAANLQPTVDQCLKVAREMFSKEHQARVLQHAVTTALR